MAIAFPELKSSAGTQRGRLYARFMGVSTISLSDGNATIMTDGFFSRPGILKLLTGRLESDPDRVSKGLAMANVTSLQALFVAHAHHDHAMDSALVATRTGAVIAGSESVCNIALGAGFSGRIITLVAKQGIPIKGFTVTPYESPHSSPCMFPGHISRPLRSPARLHHFRCGTNYSFHIRHESCHVLIHPSANFVAGMFQKTPSDVVFLGVGRLGVRDRSFIENYWDEVVLATNAKLVIPIHWDEFTVPLDRPLRPIRKPLDDFERSMALITEIAARSGIRVALMVPFAPVELER